MAKTKISEWSSTPANNTDIDSINIAEGCAPSGINDAIRELMAQLKDFQTGAVGDSFGGPITGAVNATVGATTPNTGAFTTLAASSTLSVTGAGSIQGLTVGRGAGAIATNTAVGSGALQANTTGSISVALGYQAGYAKTTAGANVAIGHQAQYAGTTGDDNVSVGTYALYNNTGANNVAIGSVALGNAANTGSGLVAVGRDALRNNTTASNSTAVGYQAGYTNQTGGENVFVGNLAGYTSNVNNTNVGNTCIGARSGYALTTGVGNTFVGGNNPTGSGSGQQITTGSYNTIIGGYSGNTATLDIRGESNYVVLADGAANIVAFTKTGQTIALQGATSTAGAGIAFPATQSASSNANTLDDYEEGTFTPSIGGTATYNSQIGRYTKIGRLVTVTCRIYINALGTGSTTTMSGLPFTVGASGLNNAGSVGFFINLSTSTIFLTANATASATTVTFAGLATSQVNTANAIAVFANSTCIDFTITYEVT